MNKITPPRYDDIFYDGLDWLDSLAGPKLTKEEKSAGIAQLVEHLTCNENARGSIPLSGSKNNSSGIIRPEGAGLAV